MKNQYDFGPEGYVRAVLPVLENVYEAKGGVENLAGCKESYMSQAIEYNHPSVKYF